jgi:V/A-type H+-transporting ATPase subunit D
MSPAGRAAPPGRAGRLWLRRRLLTAQRGRSQLDRKLRILVPERRRLVNLADRYRQDWVAACDEADTWLRRAALLGGQDALALAQTRQRASLTVDWASAMGVSYPVDVRVVRTGTESERLWGNAALAPATSAAWRMVEAGARLAAMEEAVRRLETEVNLTRRRLRALDQRWLPQLEDALRDLELALEQAELDDGIRLRHGGATGPGRGDRS